jgi:capsular exopolysaccharide synthesis family protein
MSRIQDILAKAERDGTARRTQSTSNFPLPNTTVVDGTSALDSAPSFAPTAAPAAPPAPPAAPVAASSPSPIAVSIQIPIPAPATVETRPTAVPARPEPAESRTVTATLHPLLVTAIAPHSVAAEQYRTLRARISHREETMPIRTLMVTSPTAGEGKSLTVANLALTMAQEFQRRVVLVDADFRGCAVHSLFGLSPTPGLAELLNGEATLDEVLVHMPDYRLTIIPAGRTPQFPTELLGSTAMRRIVDTLRARFDRVLFDMPAVMPLADVGTLSPMADGVLMVVRAGLTQRPALDQALAVFDEQKVIGVVLNEAN